MGGTVVDVLARLRADASGMKSGFAQAEQAAKGFSSKTHTISTAIGTALGQVATQAAYAAGRAVVSFVSDSVNAARDINETVSKVGVIFGDQAAEIEKFANSAATSLGLSRQAAMDGASTFAVFGKSAGLAGGDLTKFSTDLTGLSSDLASFYNTSPEEAITAIGAALRGESEPIRKYGILLDDASLRQKALEMGIVSTTKSALTPQQRVLAAQALILKQTGDAQGDFARTSGGLANQQRILAAQVQNVKTVFGQALLPVVLKVTTAFTSKILPAIQSMAQWISTNLGPAVENLMGKFGGLFKSAQGGASILSALKTYVQGVGDAFSKYILPAIKEAAPKFMALFSVIQQNVVPALVAIVGFIAKQVFPIFAKLSGGVLSIVAIFAEKLAPVIKTAGEIIRTKLIPALTDIFKKAQPVINTIIKLGKDLATIAGSIIGFVAPIILKLASILITILKPAFIVVIAVIGAILKVIGTLVAGVKNIGTAFQAVKNVAITAFNLMMSGIGVVVNKIIDIFNGLIKAWNLVPFHDDVQEIAHVTMPALAKSASKVKAASGTAAQGLAGLAGMTRTTKEQSAAFASTLKTQTAATEAAAEATKEAAKAQEDFAKRRSEAVASMKEMTKVQFGEPSELRKALGATTATVDSIIGTYNNLEKAITERFAGLNAKGGDKMIAFLKTQTQALVNLAKTRELVVAEVAKAQQKLEDVINARLDFSLSAKGAAQSFAQSFSGFFNSEVSAIGKNDLGTNAQGVRAIVTAFGQVGAASADEITKKFKERLETAKSFTKNIKALANAGLNKDLITQLISLGPEEGAAVAKSLLDGGQASIDALNIVNAELESVSSDFGTSLATKFFAQAQTQAEQYLAGWKAQQTSIETAMNLITSGIEAQLNLLTKGSGSIGIAAIDALIAGLKSKQKEATDLAKDIYAQVEAALAGKATLASLPTMTPAPTPTPTSTGSGLGNNYGGIDVSKGAVQVTINAGTDPQFGSNTPWAQAAAATTQKAMEEALIKAAKQAALVRRDR